MAKLLERLERSSPAVGDSGHHSVGTSDLCSKRTHPHEDFRQLVVAAVTRQLLSRARLFLDWHAGQDATL